MESGNGTPKSSPLRQKQQQQRLAAEMAAIDQSTGESFRMSTSASFNHAHHSDWLLMSPSSSAGSDFPGGLLSNSSTLSGGGGGTRYQQPPRHLCLSPISGGSNSLSTSNTLSEGMQLFLPSPSSSSSSHHHSSSMTTLLQQQQQSETMSFTSAFNSSLRHRRGKTLILPKLKIPSGRSGSGLSAEAGDESLSSFAYQSHHHHRSTTSSHFRRSVSTSTFAESSTTTAASAAATAAASTLSSSWYASASSRQASEAFSSSSVFSSTL